MSEYRVGDIVQIVDRIVQDRNPGYAHQLAIGEIVHVLSDVDWEGDIFVGPEPLATSNSWYVLEKEVDFILVELL